MDSVKTTVTEHLHLMSREKSQLKGKAAAHLQSAVYMNDKGEEVEKHTRDHAFEKNGF